MKNRSVVFTILWSFCASFLVARATSYLALLGTIPHIYPHLHGNHLHHFNYGILALILAGFLSITGSKISKNTQAIIYGIGLGLIMDEIGLLISLQNDYWTRQAFDALVITAALLINIEFFKDFWIKIFRKTTRGQSFHQIFPLKQKPTISVVIPAYNEEKSIVKTLESLKNQTYQGKVEIIVVDNNSTDNTAQIAEKLG
ncbi:MAG TPA: glycosyltransferase, partial [Candidatus Saccharimonadales bacterium]|nr:glycosyltransferase [Candidatus Saccharimonadales bacterium]